MSLISPGAEVKIVNETFHTPASAGTVPAIFVVSAENKMNASGTGTAIGTLKQNAEIPMLVTSQRELADLFGDPLFYTDTNNNPIQGGEMNEYGLQAAYSFLGANNSAWITRADVDLSQLTPSPSMPTGDPVAGTVWLDTENTEWGVFEWNAGSQKFNKVTPITVYKEEDIVTGIMSENGTDGPIPKATVGKVGSYAAVFGSTVAKIFYRNYKGIWTLVGSDPWHRSRSVYAGKFLDPYFSPLSGSLTINDVVVNFSFGMSDQLQTISDSINAANIPGINSGINGENLEIFVGPEADNELRITGDSDILEQLNMEVESDGVFRDIGLKLHIGTHTDVPAYKKRDPIPRPTGSIWIKTTPMGGGADWSPRRWDVGTLSWERMPAPMFATHEKAIYELDRNGGGSNIPKGDFFIQYNVANDEYPKATFKMYKRENTGATEIVTSKVGMSGISANTYTLTMSSTDINSPTFSSPISVSFTTSGNADDATEIAGAISGAGVPNVSATLTSDNKIKITHETGGEIDIIDDDTNPVLSLLGLGAYVNINTGTPNLYYIPGTNGSTTPLSLRASSWRSTMDVGDEQVSFYIPGKEVTSFTPNDGQIWYNSNIGDVDIMINDGTKWVGYHNFGNDYEQCDPNGPIISGSIPTAQSDGSALVSGDLWLDTSDLEQYPIIRRYNKDAHATYGYNSSEYINGMPSVISGWELIDTTDQTSENGVVFADARFNTTGANSNTLGSLIELLESDYVDPDCVDPLLYPRGTLLWNTRRSGFNVKRFVKNYIDTMSTNTLYYDESMMDYSPDRWVTESPNKPDGAGTFGRAAQRTVVITALKALLTSTEEMRDAESKHFSLMATPGYPEVTGDMVTLNYDRKISSFVIADSPARLHSSSTAILEWASNAKEVPYDNDQGLVTNNEYVGVYYPWGMSTDNNGNNVMVPPSHMMLRTIAESDSVSFPWFAPAGSRRGRITNASSVGYLTSESEYRPVALNEGQRDILYQNGVNPISMLSGVGLIAHGQKTRAGTESGALDRINVARLVVYLRRQLELVSRPFTYQPNDKLTRNELSNVISGLLLELMSQRAIYDFLVVCDESNNTPTRITRQELWVDVAVEPMQTVEFIYVPLRLRNPGTL